MTVFRCQPKSLLLFFNFTWALQCAGRTLHTQLPILNHSKENSGKGYGNWRITKNGEVNVINALVKPHNVIFDVGGHHGEWSEIALKAAPSVAAYIFEPVPTLANHILKALRGKNFKLFPIALNNQDGQHDFFVFETEKGPNGQCSLFPKQHVSRNPKHREAQITVQTRTLDSICEEHQIKYIDMLKIDAEGAELAILQGSKKLLNKHAIGAIQFEYGLKYKDSGTKLADIFALLIPHDFKFFRILPNGLLPIEVFSESLECYRDTNYLALQPKKFALVTKNAFYKRKKNAKGDTCHHHCVPSRSHNIVWQTRTFPPNKHPEERDEFTQKNRSANRRMQHRQ